jgi:hypothetical protein
MIQWLQSWYSKHCDGVWEHTYGVRIDTIDNPGWSLKIDLVGTQLEHREFVRRDESRSDDDWLSLWVENGVFNGTGDPKKLEVLIAAFRGWAET